MSWQQKHTWETGNRSMEFRDQKSWDKRTPEEKARLDFLRRKQQPEVDWTRNWENFRLDDKISDLDVFEAGKVRHYSDEAELEAVVASVTRTESITHLWETYRLKAVLRAGKTLPYALMKKIGPKSQWKTISRWIEEAGELPGLSEEVLSAIQHVNNQGYRGALEEMLGGDIAPQGKGTDAAKYRRQVHALELVVKILRSWEAERNSGGIRPNAGILERQDNPDYEEA